MAYIKGLRGTGNVTPQRIVVDMDDTIYLLDPNASPLLLLMQKLGKATTHNPEFSWMEDDYVSQYDSVNGDQTAGNTATSLVVNDSTIFRVNDLIMIPQRSNRVARVTAVNSATDTLTIVWLDGGGGVDVFNGDTVALIGNAFEEGDGGREMLSTEPVIKENYTQIFKEQFGVTETLNATKLYGGKELDRIRKMAGIRHSLEIQKAVLFGQKSKDTSGTHPRRTMDGITKFITTNVDDLAGAPLTETAWEGYMEMAFDKGSDTKYFLCAPKILSYVDSWARGKLRMLPKDKTYGIRITQYQSTHGNAYLINARKIFDRAPWDSMVIGLDLPNLKYVVLNGRGTKLKTNVQQNVEDKEEDMYITECSVKVVLEQTHSMLINVG